MKEEKVVVLVLLQVLVLVMGLCESSISSPPYVDQMRNRRNSMLDEPTSSLPLHRVGSSIVLPVYGNVYPIGCVSTSSSPTRSHCLYMAKRGKRMMFDPHPPQPLLPVLGCVFCFFFFRKEKKTFGYQPICI
jgi:hypothetical protein